MSLDLDLDAIERAIQGMSPDQRMRAQATVSAAGITKRVWLTQGGPQGAAFDSEADELLYGGAAGGGKTDLIVGLATTKHRNSVVYRRQSNDLDDFWARLTEVAEPIIRKNDTVKKHMRTNDGRQIFGGHLGEPGSEKSAMGRARDLIAFDEGAQLDEFKVEFTTRWLRTTVEGQRCRVVIATNPPIPEMIDGQLVDNGSGDWLMRWFAPWLDDRFPNPARQGELRWCYMKRDGDRLTTVWVDQPGAYWIETGEYAPSASEDDIYQGKVVIARSRTFIKSLLKDNAFLRKSGYAERMASTPEPLKSMLLLGLFTVKAEDHNMQVIPTQWVLLAQERWAERVRLQEHLQLKMLVLAADIAQGGADTTVLSPLYETDFYGELDTAPGRETPTGREVVKKVLDVRKDKALVVLDASGGWAGSTSVLLEDNHDIHPEMFVASRGSTEWTKDGNYKFLNGRAEAWWKFREALDPKSGYNICLPPSDRLRAQLTAPQWEPRGKHLIVEAKEDVRKRLSGASTDEADAVIMARMYREQAIAERQALDVDKMERLIYGHKEAKQMAIDRMHSPELEDPLKDW